MKEFTSVNRGQGLSRNMVKEVRFKPDETLCEVLGDKVVCQSVCIVDVEEVFETIRPRGGGKRRESFKSDDYTLEKELRKRSIG